MPVAIYFFGDTSLPFLTSNSPPGMYLELRALGLFFEDSSSWEMTLSSIQEENF